MLKQDPSDHLLLWLVSAITKASQHDYVDTFQVEKNVRLVVLEHLSHKLGIHVLDVDLLQILVQHHDGLVQLLLSGSQHCFRCASTC